MNIKGYEISQHIIESYLRACKYNNSTGSVESDQMQKQTHQDIIDAAGISEDSPDYDGFCFTIIGLVDDLLIKGY